MRWIYISPHFDDAVLSCGGLIWEQTASGMPVEIWTICAGDPPEGKLSEFATALHREWRTGSASQTVALRRVEDRAAARRVGAVTQHFSIPDCIYRRSKSGKALYPRSVFVPYKKSELTLVDEIAALIKLRLKPQDTLVCPLGIGKHIDHLLARAAVERLNRAHLYYADIPYYLNHPRQLKFRTNGLVGEHYAVGEQALRAWQEGIAAYNSQISGLFEDVDAMRSEIGDYYAKLKGINLWKVA